MTLTTSSLHLSSTIHNPLAIVQLDNSNEPTPIFKGMKVMIMQNRDKEHGVVNGQMAHIHDTHNKTVILQLPNKKLAPIYPVTVTQTPKK